MEVCQVCGAFLVTNDSSDRLEAHYQGKQHQGYLKIRETLDQMKVRVKNSATICCELIAKCSHSSLDHPVVIETTLVHDMTTAIAETEVGTEITVDILIAIEDTENATTDAEAETDEETYRRMIGTVKSNVIVSDLAIMTRMHPGDPVLDLPEEAVTINDHDLLSSYLS